MSPEASSAALDLVTVLKSEPIPYRGYDVSKLRGREDTYRVRVGGIRLVYRVDWAHSVVDVEYIGPRGRAYKSP